MPWDRVFRWVVTGTTTTLLDVAIFHVLFGAWDVLLAANAVSLSVSTTLNYLMHHAWSFRATRAHRGAAPRFLVSLGVYYVINSTLVAGFVALGVDATVAKVVSVPLQAPLNFWLFNRWVFHARD